MEEALMGVEYSLLDSISSATKKTFFFYIIGSNLSFDFELTKRYLDIKGQFTLHSDFFIRLQLKFR